MESNIKLGEGNMSNFFDKAKHDMGKYAKAAEIKALEIAESTKIKLEIYGLKKEKNEVLLSIGKMVYKMFRRGEFDRESIEKECRRAAQIDEEIKKVKERRHHIHHTAKEAYKNAHRD